MTSEQRELIVAQATVWRGDMQTTSWPSVHVRQMKPFLDAVSALLTAHDALQAQLAEARAELELWRDGNWQALEGCDHE